MDLLAVMVLFQASYGSPCAVIYLIGGPNAQVVASYLTQNYPTLVINSFSHYCIMLFVDPYAIFALSYTASVIGLTALLGFTILYCIYATHHILGALQRGHRISENTYRMHRTLVRSLMFQMLVPLFSLIFSIGAFFLVALLELPYSRGMFFMEGFIVLLSG